MPRTEAVDAGSSLPTRDQTAIFGFPSLIPIRTFSDGIAPKVAARVQELRRQALAVADQQVDASVEGIVRGLVEIGFADPGELFDDAGAIRAVRDMPAHLRRTIASLEVGAVFVCYGAGGERDFICRQRRRAVLCHAVVGSETGRETPIYCPD